MDRLQEAFEQFRSSRRRCVFVALAFSALLFVTASCAWVPSGVNDDWAIANLLSGNWPGPQGYCLFLNVALTWAIYALNGIMPSVNWFFACEGITSFAAFFTIAYLALSRLPLPFACLALGATVELVLPGCTYESNFTYVSAMAACAGCMLLVCSLMQARHSAKLVGPGIVLLVISALWRWKMFLLCVPAFGVAALALALSSGPGRPAASKLARLWPFALALALVGAFYVADRVVWQQPDLDEWMQFNDARCALMDYERRPYEEVADSLAAIGVSENDYALLESWVHEDPDFYTVQRLRDIADVAVMRNDDAGSILAALARYFWNLLTAPRMAFAFIATVVLSLCCLEGRARRCALIVVGVTLVVSSCLVIAGRLPSRVRYPLWMFSAVACGIAAFCDSGEKVRDACEPKRPGRLSRALAAASLAVPVVAVAFVLATALPNLNFDRAKCIVAQDRFEASSYLLDYIGKHPQDTFVMNTSTASILMFNHLVVAPYSHDLIMQTSTIGGWAARSPHAVIRNAERGLANPIKDLVDNGHAYYLSVGTNSARMLERYLKEHYYPDVTATDVEVLQNPESTVEIHVCKFTS